MRRELSEERGTVVSSSFFSDPCNLGNGDGPHYKYRNSGWDFLFNKWLCYAKGHSWTLFFRFYQQVYNTGTSIYPKITKEESELQRGESLTQANEWMPKGSWNIDPGWSNSWASISVWSVWSLQQIFKRHKGSLVNMQMPCLYPWHMTSVLEVRPGKGAVHFNKHLRG